MSGSDRKGSVMIVDDTPDNLTVLRQMLTENGYHVRPALNGEIALGAVKTCLPDLILLDIMMPGMNGYEVCRRLKSDDCTKDIPIIFISALHELSDKIRSFSVGGVDYITKPFQAEEVIARVGAHVSLFRLRTSLEEKVAELQTALEEIKTLRGLVPICSSCKKMRDDEGYWSQLEVYIQKHTEAELTHGICPECMKTLYPEVSDQILRKKGLTERY